MPTQTERYLYSILKQIDIKQVKWGLIAQENGISNAHAARMRYSRFKAIMEESLSGAEATGAVVMPKPREGSAPAKLGRKRRRMAVKDGEVIGHAKMLV